MATVQTTACSTRTRQWKRHLRGLCFSRIRQASECGKANPHSVRRSLPATRTTHFRTRVRRLVKNGTRKVISRHASRGNGRALASRRPSSLPMCHGASHRDVASSQVRHGQLSGHLARSRAVSRDGAQLPALRKAALSHPCCGGFQDGEGRLKNFGYKVQEIQEWRHEAAQAFLTQMRSAVLHHTLLLILLPSLLVYLFFCFSCSLWLKLTRADSTDEFRARPLDAPFRRVEDAPPYLATINPFDCCINNIMLRRNGEPP